MLQTTVGERRKVRAATICMEDGCTISSVWIVLTTTSKTPPLDLTDDACGWLKIL